MKNGYDLVNAAAYIFPDYRAIGYSPNSVLIRHKNYREYPNAVMDLSRNAIASMVDCLDRHAERVMGFAREGDSDPRRSTRLALACEIAKDPDEVEAIERELAANR